MFVTDQKQLRPSSQSGFTLTEALISVVIGAVATLALVQVNTGAIAGAASAKLRDEALGLAQQKVEQLRNLGSLSEYAALASSHAAESLPGIGTGYTRSWTVTKPTGSPAHARVAVTVAWQDSDGVSQSVVAESLLAEVRPEKSGQWYLSPQAAPAYGSGEPQANDPDLDPTDPPVTDQEDPESQLPESEPEGGDIPEDQGEMVADCSVKEIDGSVTGVGKGQAHKVTVEITEGSCSGVRGDKNEASFSCTVACEGTVTLTAGTEQTGASVSPATINLILGEHGSPIPVAIKANN